MFVNYLRWKYSLVLLIFQKIMCLGCQLGISLKGPVISIEYVTVYTIFKLCSFSKTISMISAHLNLN